MSPEKQHQRAISQELHAQWRDLAVSRQQVGELLKQGETNGDLNPVTRAFEELELKTSAYDQLFQQQEQWLRALFNENFLGVQEWRRAFGVEVSRAPPIPESVTEALLTSPCPLSPMRLIKDTHALVLIPKGLDGDPLTARKLAHLCAGQQKGESPLIDPGIIIGWYNAEWASKPQERIEWILIPKSDAAASELPEEKHLRFKNYEGQVNVLQAYYPEYRVAKVLERMTAALLYHKVQKTIFGDYFDDLRCAEGGANGRVFVGNGPLGLVIDVAPDNEGTDAGIAMVRRLDYSK